jgi:serine/threonine protein kinase
VNVEKFGNETYFKNSGKTKQLDYIVLELASGGELFDFISSSGRFEEPLARYYMK